MYQEIPFIPADRHMVLHPGEGNYNNYEESLLLGSVLITYSILTHLILTLGDP